jgi:hypothetical protein
MSKTHSGSDARQDRSAVVSKEGAAIRVERIELTPTQRRSLTTDVRSIGSVHTHNRQNGKS